MEQASPPTMGFSFLQVTIEEIDHETGIALCTDQFGKPRKIAWNVQRAKGGQPQPGETWIADRSMGFWALAAIVWSPPPIVIGNTGGNEALESLLAALDERGFIRNQTTSP